MLLRFYFISVFILIANTVSFSQNNFQMFFEKVYVVTDRNHYAAGEDIWFEAYLVNAQTNVRINTSANLYVEIVNPDGLIIAQETVHMQNGLGNGDFVLPAAVASGNYQIRAYTNWMKNFGTLFMFSKPITVAMDQVVKTVIPKYAPTVVTEATNKSTAGVNRIYFFPEGGTMVNGLPAHIAVRTVDAYGKAIAAKGKIVNDAGDSVSNFTTGYNGFGSFIYTPLTGVSYQAEGKYYGREIFRQALPKPSSEGLVLAITEADKIFVAKVQMDAATAAQQNKAFVHVVVRHTGKKCFSDSAKLNGQTVEMHIVKDSLPLGVNAITIYDADMRPQCERLIFVEKENAGRVFLKSNQSVFNPRDSSQIDIAVTDLQGSPVVANLSLAVTDAGLIEKSRSNILSYLLLESEIKGEIENPVQYFDETNIHRKEQLDLLLQTQGWRSFLWRRLKDTSIVIKYLPEPGITIAGRVRRALVNQAVSNANITLYAGKSSGDKIFFTKTLTDGRFFLDGLPLSGLQDIKLVVRNNKNKKEGMIMLDSVLGKPLPVSIQPNLVYDTSAITANFWKKLASNNNLMKEQQAKVKGDLGNVTVQADAIKKERIQESGLKFGSADSLFVIQPSDAEYETLAQFIIHRYPGAYTSAESAGFFFYGDGGVKILPRWIVDGNEDRFSIGSPFELAGTDVSDIDPSVVQPISSRFERIDYYNIPIKKVKKIYIEPQVGRSGSLMYIVHLSLLPGAFETDDLSQIITQINGYYEAREYFVPDFSANTNGVRNDLRSTIYWVPNIKTDANGKASIRYKNGDAKTTIRVSLEGVTNNGLPVATSMTYEVK